MHFMIIHNIFLIAILSPALLLYVVNADTDTAEQVVIGADGMTTNLDRAKVETNYYDDDDFDDDDFIGEEEYDDDDYVLPPEDENCKDEHEKCEFWAMHGECDNNPGYMLVGCKKSCNSCGSNKNPSEKNHEDKVKKEGLASEYGDPQDVSGPFKEKVLEKVEEMVKYMKEEVMIDPKYEKVRDNCENRNSLCAFWAVKGECEKNPSYMKIHCPPVCKTCDLLDIDARCPKDPNAVDAMGPGDLHKMFERILIEEGDNVTVYSRPEYAEGDDATNANYIIGPWVITVDNVISDEECERLIELGGHKGYERSTDVGKQLFDGTFDAVQSKTRTSANAWCTDDCYKDPLAMNAMASIERLTGVPDINSEYFQLLKYTKGQFYRRHHDYIDQTWDRAPGPRILTAFLYLNDVDAGGGTNFPGLNLTVMPKKGKMLLWPSVLNEDPNRKDYRTDHQALDVEAGVKYAANSWIHLRDFKTPHEEGCS